MIHIIGGGAVGLLLASCLTQSSTHAIKLVTRTTEQAVALQRDGLACVCLDGKEHHVAIHASTKLEANDGDLIIVAVKSNHVANVVSQLPLNKKVTLLFVQNGLAHLPIAQTIPIDTVLVGSAQFGATKLEMNRVAHKGIGPLKIAVVKGDAGWSHQLFAQQDEYLPIMLHRDAINMLLEKALFNCCINPLTALLQVTNGELITNERAYRLLQQVYSELMQAFPAMQSDVPFENIVALCERTATNTSSMLADRLANRPMEIEAIIGAVLERALAPVPTLQTLYMLLLAINEQKGA